MSLPPQGVVPRKKPPRYRVKQKKISYLQQLQQQVKAPQLQSVPAKVEQLNTELKTTQKQLKMFQNKLAQKTAQDLLNNVTPVGNFQVIQAIAPVTGMADLRQIADNWKNKNASDVLILGAKVQEKANLLVAVNQKAIDQGLQAGTIIKAIAGEIGGGGGGRADLAQAGGKNQAGLQKALQKALTLINNWSAVK